MKYEKNLDIIKTNYNNTNSSKEIDREIVYTEGDYIQDEGLARAVAIVGSILDYMIKMKLTDSVDYVPVLTAYINLSSKVSKSKRTGGHVTLKGIHKFINSDSEHTESVFNERCQSILDELDLPKHVFTRYKFINADNYDVKIQYSPDDSEQYRM